MATEATDTLNLLRRRQVSQITGLSKSTISDYIARGEFPQPVRLSEQGRCVAWLESEVLGWVKQRVAKRDGGQRAA